MDENIYTHLSSLQVQHEAILQLITRLQNNMSTMLDGILAMQKENKDDRIRLQEAIDVLNDRIDTLNTFSGNIRGIR